MLRWYEQLLQGDKWVPAHEYPGLGASTGTEIPSQLIMTHPAAPTNRQWPVQPWLGLPP